MVYSELFEITDNKAQIDFNVKVSNAKRLRINRVIYRTSSTNNYFLLIRLSGWIGKNSYKRVPFTKLLTLPRTTLTELDYQEIFPDHWDVETSREGSNVDSHTIEIYINNDPSNSDIDELNPIYIEIQYE